MELSMALCCHFLPTKGTREKTSSYYTPALTLTVLTVPQSITKKGEEGTAGVLSEAF
jgi:hypothetical protein